MAKNRISQLRKSRGLTQRALAELVGTSQQQVQRIEAGVQGVRLELAIRMAAALGDDLSDVFPSLAGHRKRKVTKSSRQKEAISEETLAEAGIDPDPAQWTIKLFAYDGRIFLHEISSSDKSRLEQILSDGDKDFAVFATDAYQVAFNIKKIAAAQFLFDFNFAPSAREEEDDRYEMRLHLSAAQQPLVFGVEPDARSSEEDQEGSLSQLQNMFFDLDTGSEGETVCFDDIDGERVYIRPSEILAIEVPLICCDPSLWDAHLEGYLEDEKNKDASSHSEKVGQ